MVYCGKPSKACRQCRNRNIKCDRKKDTCGQCRRAQLICPGYHNPANLVFRDETQIVLKRVHRNESSSIPRIVWEPLEVRAKALFISHHVLGDAPILVYMPFFFTAGPLPMHVEFFESTLRAVSLAYMANEIYSHNIRLKAMRRYSSALRLTQQSLQEPEVAAHNLTILTTLLLDHFEYLTLKEHGQIKHHSGSHLKGALAIAKFKGYEKFQDPLSKAIFMHLSSSILSDCLRREVEVPVEFLLLQSQVRQFVDVTQPEWQVLELMVRVAKIRSGESSAPNSEFDSAFELQKSKTDLKLISQSIKIGVPFIASNERTIQNTARLNKDVEFLGLILNKDLDF